MPRSQARSLWRADRDANAPNPVGQSILHEHFEDGVGAMGVILGALAPTIIAFLCFLLFR